MDDVLARVELRRRRFTVEEYYRMAAAGILTEDDRVELIEGEIVQMTPIGAHHAACVVALTRRLVSALGDRALLSPQNPVRLPRDTEPQPDVVLLRPPERQYWGRTPRPEDVLLLVEVADTSYAYDRNVKIPLYARAAIPEVWIVDLAGEAIEVYREPGAGGYASSRRAGRGATVAPAAFPDVVLAVDEIVPPG
jgi:Uma2 family endonuclease